MTDSILILDFGSQVTQLIARRVREAGVYCQVMPYNCDPTRAVALNPRGIILSGGPASVTDTNSPKIPDFVLNLDVPIFGICYGQQALMQSLGGKVSKSDAQEFGRSSLDIVADHPLISDFWFPGLTPQVWMSHGDKVTELAEGFRVLARSAGAPYALVAHETKPWFASQFHPEVVHTPDGAALLGRFVREICGCSGDWTMASYRSQAIASIRRQVGSSKVICGLSGGVDSSVAAVLLHEAIGDQLTCIFVDHGLLRKDERSEVEALFQGSYNIPLITVDASRAFFDELEGVSDPEVKRKIIGRMFVEVFEAEAKKIQGVNFLAQGTLYPDVIESVSFDGGPSVTIKSHHNVGGLPERMGLKLVEPLRELFKDEVRALGREMGMPEMLVGRHPFPGPGLAIRIPGEVDSDSADLLREVDAVYLDQIRRAGLYDKIWQAFAVLLPVRSVGVMGDGRTYERVAALRAVTSTDGMTADVYPFEAGFLTETATRIINEVRGVNRVVYDYTSKPPGTIEWE